MDKKRVQYAWILLLLLLWLPSTAWGQSIVLKDAGIPTEMDEGDFYLDTLAHSIWVYDDWHWKSTGEGEYDDIFACGSCLMVYYDGVYQVYNPVFDAFLDTGTQYYCADSVLWLWNSQIVVAYGPTGKIELPVQQFAPICWSDHRAPKIVQGIPAFCFVANAEGWRNTDCKEWRNWGMLGINGQWLIPPKFDEPFHFENGVAKVLFYGQKHTINEQGEFVE